MIDQKHIETLRDMVGIFRQTKCNREEVEALEAALAVLDPDTATCTCEDSVVPHEVDCPTAKHLGGEG